LSALILYIINYTTDNYNYNKLFHIYTGIYFENMSLVSFMK